VTDEIWKGQQEALGALLRAQRQVANLSLRETARLAEVSNAYLSQVERGLHQPSVRVIRALSDALGISMETLLAQAGLAPTDRESPEAAGRGGRPGPTTTVAAILADPLLTPPQREALLSIYRTYTSDAPTGAPADEPL
jgi:transcriptional regulator with XRE-family HTH domain